jgi:hypothetical protein
MTEKHIMDCLRQIKEIYPKATIGFALERMFNIDPFTKVKSHSDDSFFIYVNYPTDNYNENELVTTICEIYSKTTLGEICLLEEKGDYGITIYESLQKHNGHCTPLPPTITNVVSIWRMLSSRYKLIERKTL